MSFESICRCWKDLLKVLLNREVTIQASLTLICC